MGRTLKITLLHFLISCFLFLPSETLPAAQGLLSELPPADLSSGCDSPPRLPAASSGSRSPSCSVRAGENSEQGRCPALTEIRQATVGTETVRCPYLCLVTRCQSLAVKTEAVE